MRTPKDPNWKVVRNYEEFVDLVSKTGLENIETISLDHDLGPIAMSEYFNNVSPNYKLDYNNLIEEKTGYDCAKWLVDYCMDNNLPLPDYIVHSMNPAGGQNIKSLLDQFKEFQTKN